jgi:hypothetical protein
MKDEMFSILPSHFAPSTLEDLNRLGWNIILPGYEHYPESFKSLVPYLLATLVYHEQFLRENLNRNHPIFQARVFTDGYVSMLKDKVILGLGSCPHTDMQSSGVPQSLRLATKIAEVTKEMNELKTTIKSKLDDVSAHLSEEMDSLPMKLTNEKKSNFEITGMIQVTRNHMLNMFSEFTNQLRHEFRQQQQMEQNANTAVNNASSTEHSSTTATFETWHWGEKFHMVPQGFKLPLGLKVKAIWDLWYFGDKNAKIQPYKFLMCRNDLTIETDRVLLSKITFAMKVMNNIAVSMNFLSVTTNITSLTKIASDELFEKTFIETMRKIYGDGAQVEKAK